MEKKILLKNLTEKMDKVLLNLEHDFNGLRTGRASADFLAPVLVESYGNKVPINQISTIFLRLMLKQLLSKYGIILFNKISRPSLLYIAN